MKAIQFQEYGPPDVLKLVELDIPEPSAKEVLVKIHAIGVNYADTARREGAYVVPTPLPYVPGAEIAGVVEQVGEGVTSVKRGDRVVTLVGSKNATGYAEYTLAPEAGLIPIPEGVSFKEAAALPLQGLTAYHVLKTMGRLEEGETVLVHAAAGGVGTLAVQLARIFGAGKVIATASTKEKLALAEELGATHLINYTDANWQAQVLEVTNGKGVDVALEMAGGEVFHQTVNSMAPFGRLVVYGVASGQQSRLNPSRLMAQNVTVSGFFLPIMFKKPALYQQSLKELLHYYKEGMLQVVIGGEYPLEEARNVHRLLQSRQTTGKLILVP